MKKNIACFLLLFTTISVGIIFYYNAWKSPYPPFRKIVGVALVETTGAITWQDAELEEKACLITEEQEINAVCKAIKQCRVSSIRLHPDYEESLQFDYKYVLLIRYDDDTTSSIGFFRDCVYKMTGTRGSGGEPGYICYDVSPVLKEFIINQAQILENKNTEKIEFF